MATTRIIPLHAGKGRTVGKAISECGVKITDKSYSRTSELRSQTVSQTLVRLFYL